MKKKRKKQKLAFEAKLRDEDLRREIQRAIRKASTVAGVITEVKNGELFATIDMGPFLPKLSEELKKAIPWFPPKAIDAMLEPGKGVEGVRGVEGVSGVYPVDPQPQPFTINAVAEPTDPNCRIKGREE